MKTANNERKKERISVDDFLAVIPSAAPIFDWFKDRVMVEREHGENQNIDFYWLTIETRYDQEYNVRVNTRGDGTVGFCAWTTNRLVQPFETWNRGDDFTEGTMDESTVIRFVKDIIKDLFVMAPHYESRALHGEVQIEKANIF